MILNKKVINNNVVKLIKIYNFYFGYFSLRQSTVHSTKGRGVRVLVLPLVLSIEFFCLYLKLSRHHVSSKIGLAGRARMEDMAAPGQEANTALVREGSGRPLGSGASCYR
jgi:hypothetical protein